MVCSCKSEQQKLDDKVRYRLKEYNSKIYHKSTKFEITKITYDTIGDGKWAYDLAHIMLNTKGIISDSVLFHVLETTSANIDTNDKRLRIIASVDGKYKYGDKWKSFPDPEYTIGIIGDSLTEVNESSLYALLNICNSSEKRIIDIANVVELGKRSLLKDSVLRKQIDLGWYLGKDENFLYSKEKPFYSGKYVKDTLIALQFLGYQLNGSIDSVNDFCLNKEEKHGNFYKYKTKKQLTIIDSIYSFDIELFVLDGRISMIRAKCTQNITTTVEKMYQIKYGEETPGDIDNFFYERISYRRPFPPSIWNFRNNCIVIDNYTEDVGKWDYPCGSNRKEWFHYYYTFHGLTITYCDKQMYRRLKIYVGDMQNHKKEIEISESKRKAEELRLADSIRKRCNEIVLINNSNQI